MEWILVKLGIEAVQYTLFGVGGVIIAWMLKKIPNESQIRVVVLWSRGSMYVGAV
jgi:hypothetical protein